MLAGRRSGRWERRPSRRLTAAFLLGSCLAQGIGRDRGEALELSRSEPPRRTALPASHATKRGGGDVVPPKPFACGAFGPVDGSFHAFRCSKTVLKHAYSRTLARSSTNQLKNSSSNLRP